MRDITKPGYRIKHVDGTYTVRKMPTQSETIWRNMMDHRRTCHPDIADAVDKIVAHAMFKYVKIGALLGYCYLDPDTKDLEVRRSMKLEALKYILSILDNMERT